MDPYDDEMIKEEKIEVTPPVRYKPVKPRKMQPPTKYGLNTSKYEIIDRHSQSSIRQGTLFLLDRQNKSRVINQFGNFYNTDWIKNINPSKLHSLVAEWCAEPVPYGTMVKTSLRNGALRGIDHTKNISMMSSGKVFDSEFTDNYMLNIELDTACTGLEIMPIPEAGVDSLAQAVDANNEIKYNGMVNVIAGGEDGSIVRTEVHIPEQEDNNQEYKDASNEDYASEGHQLKHGSKRNMLKPKKTLPNRFANNEILHPQKPNELVYLHKDGVTSVCQRPSYPFQFLTTSLDGEASLGLLSNTLSQEELVILRFSNKICDEGIGEAAWMDANCFIVKNEAYGQLLLQDVREGEGKSPTHLYTTSSLCKINNMDVNFPYVGIAQDDGALAILDLRHIDIDQNYELKPLFEVNKHGEACMGVKLLKDTIRIYGCYERSGIYGYRFENEELAHDNTEWHGFYDSDKYGLPKSLHVIHQEKANNSDENSVYCQDVLGIGTYNGSYVYGLVDEEEHIEMQP